jgi:hypothetical protein
MISCPKTMIVIFWSPLGLPVIQALLPKVTFTLEFFVDANLPHIVVAKRAGNPGRRLVLHTDNASPHRVRLTGGNLEENRITVSFHPAFPPDLVPSDFFLFGALKGPPDGGIFGSPDELVEAHMRLRVPPRTILERVFLEWKERSQRSIDINGAYVDYS